MKPELFWLAMTATLTGLLWVPYILNRAVRAGLFGAMLTPKMTASPVEDEWALRLKRAHSNAVENLGVFTALVLVVHLSGASNQTTALAAAAYFWTRLVHAVVLTLGVPYLRTLIWFASWCAMMVLAYQALAK